MNPHRIQHCTNCGLTGHVFRNCLSPVTSYGIIAVRFQDENYISSPFSPSSTILNGNDSIQFLMIQRKDSLSFAEFIRGKCNVHDEKYMSRIISGMTQKEQVSILTKTFPELWFELWGESSNLRSHKADYEVSERRYKQIADHLPSIIHENPSKWVEPEWGFPKGRRNPYETDIGCAVREFQEETGLATNDFTVLQNTNCISETFFGSNQIHYCHKYYIAVCHKSTEVEMNTNNFHMTREIGAIKWCSLEEALTKIRPDNVEKREILLKAGKIMKNFHPVSTNEMTRSHQRV
jgi:8-oxo-dGTP pyrophosphatase MutT (NUDIX family)